MEQIDPNKVHQLRELLLDKLDSFKVENRIKQTLFENLALIDFQSVCVQDESFEDNDTKKGIRKLNRILISI